MTTSLSHLNTKAALIVGAGPAGLAVAYHLQRLDIPFVMLERLEVGASWARYYDALHLHTRKANVALPGLPLLSKVPVFPSGDDYFDYLQSYAKHFNFPVYEGAEVGSAEYGPAGWHVSTTQGDFEASQLIVASGIFNTPKRPQFPGEDTFTGQIIVAKDYRNPQPFFKRRVLVVGAGNTGVGIALSLAEARVDVGMVVRDGVQLVPLPSSALSTRLASAFIEALPAFVANGLLKRVRKTFGDLDLPSPVKPPLEVTPVVGYELVAALRAERIKLHPGIEALRGDEVQFVNGEGSSYATLILATGYTPTIDFLPHVKLNERGKPTCAVQGLHMVGFYYPTTRPFLVNVKSEAERVAREVEQALNSNVLPKKDAAAQKAC